MDLGHANTIRHRRTPHGLDVSVSRRLRLSKVRRCHQQVDLLRPMGRSQAKGGSDDAPEFGVGCFARSRLFFRAVGHGGCSVMNRAVEPHFIS